MEGDWKLWILLIITIVVQAYSAISTWAIRGNELKHLKEAVICFEKKLKEGLEKVEKRIERLEDFFFNKD